MSQPTFDIAQFRVNFPEFASGDTYPSSMIEFWVGLASAQVNYCVWKAQWSVGVSLYVAHELVMAGNARKASSFGGAPGVFGGVATTKTVGNGTVGYDSQGTSEKDAGYWNLTNYGRQFIRLCRIFGAGAIQL